MTRAATVRVHRAFCPARPGADGLLVLDVDESHHVVRVLRARAGDPVRVFDGAGREWIGTFVQVARYPVSVRVERELLDPVEPPVAITLVQALTRPERIEFVLVKGTEIGIRSFRLVPSERADLAEISKPRRERLGRVLIEAAKQCGRRVVPDLTLGRLDDPCEADMALVLDPRPGAPGFGSHFESRRVGRVAIAVGPEGGFSEDEIAAMTARGWTPASLGPRVLRTETAGMIAAALVLHRWGDLGSSVDVRSA